MYLLKAPIPGFHSQRLRLRRNTIANAVPRHDAGGIKEPGLEGVAVTPKTGGACEAEGGAVSKSTVAPIVENCTECNKELPGEFFACKSCPGGSVTSFTIQPTDRNASVENRDPILILCDKCAFKPELTCLWYHSYLADHFLVLVRNRNASYIHGEPEPEPAPKTKDKSEDEEPTIKSLQAQMSKMLELIEEMRTSLAALTRPAPE